MWAGVKIGLSAEPCGEPKLLGHVEESAAAEAFLPVAEVDRLQPGGQRPNNVDAERGDVGRREVGIDHPVAALAQSPDAIIQVAFHVTDRQVWQILKACSFAPTPQELELAAPLWHTKESRVVLQSPDVLVALQTGAGGLSW